MYIMVLFQHMHLPYYVEVLVEAMLIALQRGYSRLHETTFYSDFSSVCALALLRGRQQLQMWSDLDSAYTCQAK